MLQSEHLLENDEGVQNLVVEALVQDEDENPSELAELKWDKQDFEHVIFNPKLDEAIEILHVDYIRQIHQRARLDQGQN